MVKKSLLLTLLMALLVPWAANAYNHQVQVGNGTSGQNIAPINLYYNYSYTQQIYTAAQINGDCSLPGTIESISFYYAGSVTKTHPITVFMKTTEKTSFSGNSDWETVTESDIVYNDSWTVSTAGWVTITLNEPFAYDGESNLLIAIDKGYGDSYSNQNFRYTAVTNNQVIQYRSDSTDPDPYSPTTASGTSKNLPNILFNMTIAHPAPSALTLDEVVINTATISWTAPQTTNTITGYAYEYTDSNDVFTGTTTGTTANLTELTAATDYLFEVKAIYSDGESCWSEALDFTTMEACMTPENLSITNVTAHTADLTWTEGFGDGQWVLKYKLSTEEEYTNSVNVALADLPYTLTGLTAERTYNVLIAPVCDDTKTITDIFTTTVACPVPTGLAFTLTPGDGTVATFSWTENGSATAWQLCINGDEDNLIDMDENPFTYNGFTPETEYTAKVRAVCGGIDGESAWSNTVTFTPSNAYTLTVNDGTNTHSYVPFYGYYADSDANSQFIIPASALSSMQWGTINKITFYGSTVSATWNGAVFDIYFSEVSNTEFESAALVDWSELNSKVYTGSVSVVDNKMELTLTTPYQYMGGNLLIGFDETTNSSNYPSMGWYGVTQTTNTAVYKYSTNAAVLAKFLPKVTFDYEPGEEPSCIKPTGLAVNYEGGITATVTWEGEATSYNIDVNGTVTEGVTSPYILEDLELNTTYAVMVQADCGSNGTSDWTNAVSFTTDLCLPENMCAINIALTDSYGDGWNGGQLSVVDALTDDILGTYTLASGSSADYTLNLCDGLTINIVYTAGSYSTENGWVVTDINNEVICEHVGCNSGCDPTAGVQATYTVDCFPCNKPTNLAAEIQNYTSANLTWDGTNDSYNLRYREAYFYDDFENGFAKWNVIDADGDGYGFVLGSEVGGIYLVETGSLAGTGHNGSNDLVVSASYSNVTNALTPDNYMVSPKLELGHTFSFWACSQDASYPAEHFGVAVSTVSNNNPDDFTTIAAWTLTAKGTGTKANPGTTRSGNRGQGRWYQFSVDLSAYAGQEGYIAIRHFDCTDQFILNLDDVTYGPAADESWTVVEGLTTMEYLLENLNEHTDYEFQLQGVCGTTEPKLSDWTSSAYFTTLADEPQAVLDGGYWNVPETWTNNEGQVPSPDQNVTVMGDVLIGEDLTVTGEITIAEGASLTVEAGVVFNAGEINVTSPDQLIIEQGAQFMHTGEVPATLNLNYSATSAKDGETEYGEYRMIASPITPYVTVNSTGLVPASTDANYQYVDLYYFDQTSNGSEWINYKDVNNHFVTLDINKGYLYSNAQNVMGIFAGTTLPTDVDVTVELDSIAGMTCAGWNLVGNPFTCMAYIDRPYFKINSDGNAIADAEGNSLEVFEGVFVKGQDGETMTFTTTEPTRSANLALNLSNDNNLIDRAIVRFDEGRQLPKFQLNANSTKVYIQQDGVDYAIVNATEMGEMPVSFKAESNGTYTMSFSSEEVSFNYLHLIDNMTGNDVDLLATPSYTFNARTTDYANRFKLVFVLGATSMEENFVFFSNGSFIINNEGEATLQVIDVNGRILKSESINGCTNVNVNAAPGVYMLRLVNGDNVMVQKVVVR